MKATDPAMLSAAVSKTMRDASDILSKSSPQGMAFEDTSRLINCLQGAYSTRLQAELRVIVHNRDITPQEQAEAIAKFIADQNLEPVAPPTPLPAINLDDVHLLTWMGVVHRS